MSEEAPDAPGTRPVRPRHAFDQKHLAAYLARQIRGFPADAEALRLSEFQGGQSNPTYLLETPDHRYVLRRKPPGKLLASAHAVDREYRVMSALEQTGVPVPRTYCLCEDPEVIGTPFYVMDYVSGRILWDPTLPGLDRKNRAAIFDEMNRVIAALHQVDFAAVGLADYGKPGNYFSRQIGRWTQQYRDSETDPIAAMERLIEWLPAHVPPGEDIAIVHGDYRLDNLVFHPTEPRLLAVLDWELSTLGHPLGDFAYHCMTWRIPAGPFRGLAGADLPSLGIPTEDAYVQQYCHRTGRSEIDPGHWNFYLAYNLFRLAAILQGIMGRVQKGTAASPHAVAMGKAARPVADLAWSQVERNQSKR